MKGILWMVALVLVGAIFSNRIRGILTFLPSI
jgi:hypothetical protein